MGSDRGAPYRPWDELETLVAGPSHTVRPTRHPRRAVLRAYVDGGLPDRPDTWSRERAEALAAGTLNSWSRWEVAAHLSVCSRCRRGLPRFAQASAGRRSVGIRRVVDAMRRPRAATAVWAVAGAQAVAIAAILLLWSGGGPADRPLTKPEALPGLNQVSGSKLPEPAARYRAEFDPGAAWESVSAWLVSVGLTITGPDRDGRYLVSGENVSADQLVASGWIRSVQPAEGGAGE